MFVFHASTFFYFFALIENKTMNTHVFFSLKNLRIPNNRYHILKHVENTAEKEDSTQQNRRRAYTKEMKQNQNGTG
jgi:hypothetical protein